MLINKPGAEFLYNGITYRVGDVIIGSNQSEYAGLIGSILEIRDGDDKETENDTPDIYCSFEPPVLPADIAKVEAVFSDLYWEAVSEVAHTLLHEYLARNAHFDTESAEIKPGGESK